MLKSLRNIVFLLLSNVAFGQSFINGDFEINSALFDQINLPNVGFNSIMPNCNGFGNIENLDIITSSDYSGGPYSGNWFVALTGGESDLLSMELTMPLLSGNSYTISFYDKNYFYFISAPIEIGLSTSNGSFGTLVYTTPSVALESVWTQRLFTFIAPNNGQFITVRQQGSISNWVQIDNFSFDCSVNPNLGNDTTLCQGQSITLNGGSATSYLWSNGSTTSSINVSTPGNYWVQASNEQCSAIDTIAITLDFLPEINLGNDTSFCNQIQYIISPTNTGGTISNFVWQDNSTGNSLITSNSGSYWLQASNSCGVSIDSINLTLTPAITASLNIEICSGQSYILPSGITVNTAGTYFDTLTTVSGCDSVIIVNLNYYDDVFNPMIPEMGLCANDSISFSIAGDFDQITWSNGQIGNSVVIYQPGNYQVNVLDVNGCSASASFIVTELSLPSISIELSDSSICKGDCVKLSLLGTNLNDVSWSINHEYFDSNDTYILYCFNDTGSYNITVSSIEECGIAYDTLLVNINEPLVFLPSDTLIQLGDSLNLWSQGNYSEFWWQPYNLLLCDSCESQNIAITDNQLFTLFYSDTNGCIFNKSFEVSVNKEGQLYIPNSFTPNGDNINDEFNAKGTGISKFNLMIYNRIGELIFESNDLAKGWDGTYFQRQVQQDVYAYIIEYKDYNNNVKVERGFLMLAR